MKEILSCLLSHETLERHVMRDILINIADGKYPPEQITALLTCLQMRGITVDELLGFRDGILETGVPALLDAPRYIDIVGTGGDQKNTFNISTCACFVVAGAGYKVAKHGNVSATSVSSSSNVIQLHGVNFTNDINVLNRSINEAGIVYLHAPLFATAMKFVAPIRKNISFPTIFNLLGPIVNPSQPKAQLLGVANRQKEIENFEPRQSWVLSTMYRDTKFTGIARDEEAEAEEAAEIKEAAAQGKTIKSKGPIYRQIEYATEEEGQKVIQAIKDNPLTINSVTKKSGTEAPPRLYDLTSLQVDCNRKFGFSADTTLQLIQSLYEKKFTTYPRVDTTYLSDDIHAKCPAVMNGLYKTAFAGNAPYAELVKPLAGNPLKKSKKVFDSSKVTDHHAIIPTGIPPQGLSDMEQKVFDLVARAFIAAFYPDCKFETTTVIGDVEADNMEPVTFRTSWLQSYKKLSE